MGSISIIHPHWPEACTVRTELQSTEDKVKRSSLEMKCRVLVDELDTSNRGPEISSADLVESFCIYHLYIASRGT